MLFRATSLIKSVKPTRRLQGQQLWYGSRTFSATAGRWRPEPRTISLKVGGNGFVDLKIYRPAGNPRTSIEDHAKSKGKNIENVLVRFAPGPLPEDTREYGLLCAADLARALPSTTVIDLQYRLGPRPQRLEADPDDKPDHRFPTPIHDVYTAWDYITEELAEENTLSAENGTRVLPQLKTCLYGSHIGGAMALSLALTNPNLIHAVALENPLVDWVGLDDLAEYTHDPAATTSKRRNTAATRRHDAEAVAARELIKLRTHLFRTPSGYFDSFASPTLFLRAPGRDTPLTKSAAMVDPEFVHVENVPMRYGEGDNEVGVIEFEDDSGHEYGHGPYDDDWHAAETVRIREAEYARKRADLGGLEGRGGHRGGLAAGSDERADTASRSADSTSGSSQSDISEQESSQRRRKVLRRWPPNAQPDEALLPHVNVYLTKPTFADELTLASKLDLAPVTWSQGTELVELLRRACFWGREKGLAEERVNVVEVDRESNEQAVVEWLRGKFEGTGG